MNKLLLKSFYIFPDSFKASLVKRYVESKLKKHAKITVKGLENLDSNFKRPYLFVCNHLSNTDALIINKVLEKENIIFLAGKKLEANSITNLGFKIVRSIHILPNSPDKDAIKNVINAVKQGNSILIFPEGTRSRNAKMLEGKKGILLFAKLTNAPIVPIGISGTEKLMPIKEDMGKEEFFDAEINVSIGKVFNLPKKNDDETKTDWETSCLNLIMMNISALLPKEYRGFYDDKT